MAGIFFTLNLNLLIMATLTIKIKITISNAVRKRGLYPVTTRPCPSITLNNKRTKNDCFGGSRKVNRMVIPNIAMAKIFIFGKPKQFKSRYPKKARQ